MGFRVGDVLSVVWSHPILAGVMLILFTPPFFPILVFFSPLLISTALCVLALVSVGSEDDQSLISSHSEYRMNSHVQGQYIEKVDERGFSRSVSYPGESWLGWLKSLEVIGWALGDSQIERIDWLEDLEEPAYPVLEEATEYDLGSDPGQSFNIVPTKIKLQQIEDEEDYAMVPPTAAEGQMILRSSASESTSSRNVGDVATAAPSASNTSIASTSSPQSEDILPLAILDTSSSEVALATTKEASSSIVEPPKGLVTVVDLDPKSATRESSAKDVFEQVRRGDDGGSELSISRNMSISGTHKDVEETVSANQPGVAQASSNSAAIESSHGDMNRPKYTWTQKGQAEEKPVADTISADDRVESILNLTERLPVPPAPPVAAASPISPFQHRRATSTELSPALVLSDRLNVPLNDILSLLNADVTADHDEQKRMDASVLPEGPTTSSDETSSREEEWSSTSDSESYKKSSSSSPAAARGNE